ncbi:class I SAM-dependent methyltransferase [Algiphilus sp.]|uniref:class I SAM-dependent methyltransferase n=1 Tax=Algiphilus sp. TaxID=1872431 RepID=UPI003B51D5BD
MQFFGSNAARQTAAARAEAIARQREQRRARKRHAALRQWQISRRRTALEALAALSIRDSLGDVFGRWCLQIGACGRDLTREASTLRRVQCTAHCFEGGALVADPAMLPLASSSMDAVVLAFALEFSVHPHRLIREANRVLNDRGVLFIVGQSPHSIGALPRLMGLGGRVLPAGTGLVRPGRIRDWLDVLDFELERYSGFSVGPPHRGPSQGGMARTFADCYVLVARKRVFPLTLARQPLLRRRPAPAPGVAVTHFRRERPTEEERPPA